MAKFEVPEGWVCAGVPVHAGPDPRIKPVRWQDISALGARHTTGTVATLKADVEAWHAAGDRDREAVPSGAAGNAGTQKKDDVWCQR